MPASETQCCSIISLGRGGGGGGQVTFTQVGQGQVKSSRGIHRQARPQRHSRHRTRKVGRASWTLVLCRWQVGQAGGGAWS